MKAHVFLVGACLALAPVAFAQPTVTEIVAPLAAPADPLAYFADRVAAEAAIEARDFARAEPLLERLTAAYPLDAESWLGLAIAKRQLGKAEEAIAAYRRVITLAGPNYGRARARIFDLQTGAGETAAALDTLEQVVLREAYLQRPALAGDEDLAALRENPRFQELAGVVDTTGMSREEGWRTDLDFLAAEVHRLSPHHRDGALPEEFVTIQRELQANVAALSDAQIYARMARMVGTLNMNHTMMWGISPDGAVPVRPQLSFLPLQFYFFPEGVFIVGALDGSRDLIGAQVLTIDGMPTLHAFTRVRTAMSVGSDAEALWTGPWRLMDPTLLNGLGVAENTDRVTLRLRLRNGRTVTRVVRATPQPLIGKLPAPPSVATPTFLTHVRESHWLETWADSATVYAQVNQIAPDEDETLAAYGERLRQALAESGARNLVIDLRHNNGGDTTTYGELLRTVVAFSANDPNHQVYVLIGRNTYSAAVNLVSDLERLANPIFIGEQTAATGNQDGDEGAFRLPYSGLRGTVAGLVWQWNYPFDRRRFTAPDVPVQLSAADYFAGRDPALEVARRLIARRAN